MDCALAVEADAAAFALWLEVRFQVCGPESGEKSFEQAEVHLADEVGVLPREGVERAVPKGDAVCLGARFEPLLLKDLKHSIWANWFTNPGREFGSRSACASLEGYSRGLA